MKKNPSILIAVICLFLFSASTSWAGQQSISMHSSASNPCAMKHGNPCNPCGMKHGNPCSMKHNNPCGMKQSNPCAKRLNVGKEVDPKLVTRPAGTRLFTGAPRQVLVNRGKQLFSDASLGSNGLSCSSCHTGNAGFRSSFAQPYPHKVAMAKDRAGLRVIDVDEFVQFCIVVPLKGRPLAWESRDLAALTAYVTDVKQKAFMAGHAVNPCAKKHANPCNPCAKR